MSKNLIVRWRLKPGDVFKYNPDGEWRTVPPDEDGPHRICGTLTWLRPEPDSGAWSEPGRGDWDRMVILHPRCLRGPLTKEKLTRATAAFCNFLEDS